MNSFIKVVLTVIIAAFMGFTLVFMLAGCIFESEPARQTFFLKQIAVSEKRQADALERIADRVCPEAKVQEGAQ